MFIRKPTFICFFFIHSTMQSYFSCPDNHGLFVRPTQLEPTEGAEPATPSGAGSSIPLPKSMLKRPLSGKRTPMGDRSPPGKRTPVPKPAMASVAREKEMSSSVFPVPKMASSEVEELKPQSFAVSGHAADSASSFDSSCLPSFLFFLFPSRSFVLLSCSNSPLPLAPVYQHWIIS